MRAFQLTDHGGPDALRLVELPEPAPSDRDVLVDVQAIGVNFPDLLTTQGLHQHRPELPFVPGCEIAGVVRAAPDGSRWRAGDRVAAFVWQGGYAETVAVPPSGLVAVPDGQDLGTAAAMIVNYHTVHFGLARRGGLARGERLLVLGAAGGIGTAGVQVGKGLGATVLAGVANEAQAATARAAGADDVVVLERGFAARVRELTAGAGIDVVLDPLGDWLFDEAVRTLAPEGRILVVGFVAGQIPNLKVNRLLLRNASAVGVAWGAFLDVDPTLIDSAATSLDRMFADGVVRPRIAARHRFEELPSALHRLARGEIAGKAVVELPSRSG
ncbi:MAG TPA: NADPH:quinone oxidoreductase family protein [Solirubrobacter sp.]|nr:NADPH:quinone oxidoreductase family protein [Solirubrobacter sp.]